MKTTFFAVGVALLLALATTQATAQVAPKVPRIGLITQGLGTRNSQAMLRALEELGYVVGRNLVIEHRYYKGKRKLLDQIAAELVRLKVDIIVPSGPTALRPVLKATKTIPVVMPNAGSDPVKSGFVKSFGQPGGNATGLSLGAKGLGSKRFELLKEVLPSVKRVVFLNAFRNPIYLEEYKRVAGALDVALEVVDVRSNSDVEQALDKLLKKLPGAIIIERNSLTRRHTARFGKFSLAHRVPTMNGHRVFVEKGGLISYGVDYPANWRRAAIYIDKILKGAKPATLPIEPPQLEIVVNLKTAETLGVKIPPQILLEASEVIK